MMLFKFPSTPHLAVLGKADVREDKVLSSTACQEFLRHNIIVEEKIDGANLGISFSSGGAIILQNRGTILMPPGNGQWKKLWNWIGVKTDALFDCLSDRLMLFGEWCYATHSVHYSRLPDWFLCFDVFDKALNRFWSHERRNEVAGLLDIHTVPTITEGKFSLEELVELVAVSAFGDTTMEGVYLRAEENGWLLERAKLVQPNFIQAIQTHWRQSIIVPNQLLQQAEFSP